MIALAVITVVGLSCGGSEGGAASESSTSTSTTEAEDTSAVPPEVRERFDQETRLAEVFPAGFPVPPWANVASSSTNTGEGSFTLHVEGREAETAAFYREELPEAGYEIATVSIASDQGGDVEANRVEFLTFAERYRADDITALIMMPETAS